MSTAIGTKIEIASIEISLLDKRKCLKKVFKPCSKRPAGRKIRTSPPWPFRRDSNAPNFGFQHSPGKAGLYVSQTFKEKPDRRSWRFVILSTFSTDCVLERETRVGLCIFCFYLVLLLFNNARQNCAQKLPLSFPKVQDTSRSQRKMNL
jgi:hypothetical protein